MKDHPETTLEVSAQFGGRDAADAVLPHFRLLKQAMKPVRFTGFPFPQFAFILRVDGEINTFDPPGLDNIDIDRDGEYLSVDICLTIADRSNLPEALTRAILEAPRYVVSDRKWKHACDMDEFQRAMKELVQNYEELLAT